MNRNIFDEPPAITGRYIQSSGAMATWTLVDIAACATVLTLGLPLRRGCPRCGVVAPIGDSDESGKTFTGQAAWLLPGRVSDSNPVPLRAASDQLRPEPKSLQWRSTRVAGWRTTMTLLRMVQHRL